MKNLRKLFILPFLLCLAHAQESKALFGSTAPQTVLELLPRNVGTFVGAIALTGLATYVGAKTANHLFAKENSAEGFNKKTILPRIEQIAKVLGGFGLTYFTFSKAFEAFQESYK